MDSLNGFGAWCREELGTFVMARLGFVWLAGAWGESGVRTGRFS